MSRNEEDLNVFMFGKNVDLSKWSKIHPGGDKILKIFKDRDATEVFQAYHSNDAYKQLLPLLKVSPPQTEPYLPPKSEKLRQEFQKLRKSLQQKGLFTPNIFKESLKIIIILTCMILGIYIMWHLPSKYVYVGCTLFALSLHQCGWSGHDFAHHSVFKSVLLNDLCSKLLAWLQGYESLWWKDRHNPHHAASNEVGVDPDIKTTPMLHYIQEFPELHEKLKELGIINKMQPFYFIPLITMIHISWCIGSWKFIFRNWEKMKFDAFLLALNYVWMFCIFYPVGLFPYVYVMVLKGFLTGVIVFCNHYIADRLPPNPKLSWVEQTLRATINFNVGGGLFPYFTGFLTNQIEHHLFPTMPSANLRVAQPYVKEFCAEHNLEYREVSFYEAVQCNIESLTPKKKIY